MSELRTRIEALRRLERSVLVEEKLDKAVVQGWRKSWRILVKEYRQAVKARDFKKAFSALDAMRRWVENLRRDLLFKRGLQRITDPIKHNNPSRNWFRKANNQVADVFEELKRSEHMIDGNDVYQLSAALWFRKIWDLLGGKYDPENPFDMDKDEMNIAMEAASKYVKSFGGIPPRSPSGSYDFVFDALRFYNEGVERLGSADRVFEQVLSDRESVSCDDGIRKALSLVTKFVRDAPLSIDLPASPEEVRVGNMLIKFQDVTDYTIRNWGNVDVEYEDDPSLSWKGWLRENLVKEVKKAYDVLKRHGVDKKVWHGVVFFQNPSGYESSTQRRIGAFGDEVAGYYVPPVSSRGSKADTISLYPDVKDLWLVLLHELAHRAWYKALSNTDRFRFREEYFDVAKRVSSYAKNNPSEAFAELMSLYWAGKVKEKGLIDLAKRYNRKLGGR